MSKPCSRFLAYVAASLFILVVSAEFCYSQGNLLITPRRVVFDGTRRVMELNLANTGQDSAKYNVSLIQYRMNEDGSFTEITEPDPGQKFADKNVRFFPRTVTLGPSEGQVVKMQVTNLDKLEPGEYRSHVYFRSVPKQVALGEENAKADSSTVSVQLIPIFGITIPVIIRIGEDDMKVNISDFNFVMVDDTTNRVELVFNRSGKMSVYGDLKFIYVSPSGKEIPVGAVNGIAVYTPNLKRKFWMNLDVVKGVKFNEGRLKVMYVSQSDSKPLLYAESSIDLK